MGLVYGLLHRSQGYDFSLGALLVVWEIFVIISQLSSIAYWRVFQSTLGCRSFCFQAAEFN